MQGNEARRGGMPALVARMARRQCLVEGHPLAQLAIRAMSYDRRLISDLYRTDQYMADAVTSNVPRIIYFITMEFYRYRLVRYILGSIHVLL